jgi:tRNA G18 (ribose-2'-O)-methylase SpoU
MKKLSLEEIEVQRIQPEQLTDIERFPIYAMLDNIRSLYNVGAMFRTADAARIEKMLLCGITGYPPRKELDKTALGATETVPWEYFPDPLTAIHQLKSQGVQIVALEHTTKSVPHWEFDFQFPSCVVVGHEVWGIQDEILQHADAAIEIPMFGSKHSLNVSVAFSIVVYDMLAKYKQVKKVKT